MGTSPSKNSQQTHSMSTQNGVESADEPHGGRERSSQDDLDDGSFVFIDREWSCSISSAEDVLLIDNLCMCNDTPKEPMEVNCTEGVENNEHIETISSEDGAVGFSPKENTNPQQNSEKSECGIEFRKESNPIKITSNPCSVVEGFPVQLESNTEMLLKSGVCSCTPTDTTLTHKEEWIQVGGYDSTLFDIYEIFSNYGSISALAKTKEHIYVKFSSWAGVANVFGDIRKIRQLYQIDSLVKVEEDELKNHPNRTEIYLDLPSFVVAYLKEHHELSKALNIVTITTNDNICLNAPKIQQVIDHIRKNVSKGFQQCNLFPFGCLILGSCDRSVPFEIFVDVGDMYAGCHKQSSEEQIAIAKEVRKLILDDVIWYSHEESPIGVFYHKTTGLNCILNFNNGFGDRCTRLLGVFMDYDERFRTLYLMLDIWSKQCSLQGVSNGLNSYIVAVLLVFYLQVLPVPLLPPIQRIRSGRPVVIKGWDCTFAEDASLLPRNDCLIELYSLLRGFFVFYGSYDWKRVVSPVLGQSMGRDVFSSPSVPFPDDPVIARYFKAVSEKVPNTPRFDINTSMCVQDFFNLSENIAKGVSPETLLRFQSLCRQSHKMIYSAESRMTLGSHLLHMSSVPCGMSNIQRDHLTNGFSQRVKFGSVSDCVGGSQNWERTSNSNNFNENDDGVYCVCKGCICQNPRKNFRDNHQRNPKRRSFQRRANYNNFDEDRYQSNGTSYSRGRKVQDSKYSRSYRGRVFWQNGAKHNVK